jgi:hypothetical protein
MVFFAITRGGYESYRVLGNAAGALWLAAGVLTDEELAALRQSGVDASNFNYKIEPAHIRYFFGTACVLQSNGPSRPLPLIRASKYCRFEPAERSPCTVPGSISQ